MTEPMRRPTPRHAGRHAGLLTLWLAAAVLPGPLALAQPPRPWLQQLRAMFGYIPLLAPGGTRAPGPRRAEEVCLVTPRLQDDKDSKQPATAKVLLPSPTIFSQQPLAEWRLEDGSGRRLAGELARSDRPIAGAIAWRLPPLQPGQTLQLRLRSMQASGEQYVEVRLQAGSAAEQAEALQRLNAQGDRLQQVQKLLRQGKRAEALELVWAPTPSPTAELLELRRMLAASACGEPRGPGPGTAPPL